jgi:hypothetical protein
LDEVRILSQPFPGYGFEKSSLEYGLSEKPHLLVCQGTSTDMGAYYLGSGKLFVGRVALKRDLDLLLSCALRNNVKFIASLIGSGSDVDLTQGLRVLDEIARERRVKFRAAVISGEIDKEWLKGKLADGAGTWRLSPHPNLVDGLSEVDVDESVRIVSQMGPEPVMKALDLDVDVIITGRSLDVGLIAALPLKLGFEPGLTYHMAKTLECGALSASPATCSDLQFASLRRDHFIVRPPNPMRKCTPLSCAVHSFYERSDPNREECPGGYLDVSDASYEQIDERTVKVNGSKWVKTPYTIKLEGSKLVGYRTITVAGIRCPTIIGRIDAILKDVSDFVKHQSTESGIGVDDFQLMIRVYGKDGVMGELEPRKKAASHELCIIIDVLAKTQDLSNNICALTRSTLLHWGFPGRMTTAGNLAFPYSPSDIPVGKVYEFNVFHKMELDNPCEPFMMKVLEFPGMNEVFV